MSILLCICMVCTLLPATALAVEAEHPHSSHSCDGSCGHIDGDPHKDTSIEWTAWTSANSLPDSAGTYYLTDDVTISSTWYPTGEVNLCLNGYNITMTGADNAIQINSNATLTLTDCAETGKITHAADKNGHGVKVIGGTLCTAAVLPATAAIVAAACL